MNPRVSIIQHYTGDLASLGAHLPELTRETEARGAGDEIIIVDDTGSSKLRDWITENHPHVQVVQKNRREGRAKAQLMGAQAATSEFLFLLGPDVRICRGCLGPMIAAMQAPNLFAVAPVVVGAESGEPEIQGPLAIEQGRPVVLPGTLGPDEAHLRPIPFATGGAFFVRRESFMARAGFDSLFPSPYWDDADLGLTAWRQGLRIMEVPQAMVERHTLPHPEMLVPAELDQAAIERGRLLLHWKHLDRRSDAVDHVQGLWRDAVDAGLNDRREELVWMAMALDDLDGATEARSKLGPPQVGLRQALKASDPTRL